MATPESAAPNPRHNPYFDIAFHSLGIVATIARMASEQEWLATHDELTGIYNRRGLVSEYAKLRHSVKNNRDRRNDRTTSAGVMLVDLDKFKDLNDSKSYAAGNIALQKTAKILEDNTRDRDIKGRLGGDEFLVILPRITPARAYDIANAVREEIADMTDTTASIGIGDVNFDLDLEGVVGLANPALKQGKTLGGDQVILLDS